MAPFIQERCKPKRGALDKQENLEGVKASTRNSIMAGARVNLHHGVEGDATRGLWFTQRGKGKSPQEDESGSTEVGAQSRAKESLHRSGRRKHHRSERESAMEISEK